nr:hypothetical protein [Mycobacterium tuberculosis]
MPRPPSTYEAAPAPDSDLLGDPAAGKVVAVPYFGAGSPAALSRSRTRRDLGQVDAPVGATIGTGVGEPVRQPSGVWPPSCTRRPATPATATGFHFGVVDSKTSRNVNGSKYNLSAVS